MKILPRTFISERKFLFFFVAISLLFSTKTITAQSCANYAVNRSTGISYTSIEGTGTSAFVWRNTTGNQNDDNRSFPAAIGFDFWYRGVRYTTLSASLNGTLDFSASTEDGNSGGANPYGPNYNNWFSTANGTHLALAPMYDDLWTSGGGTVPIASSLVYRLSGTAPNRVLTVEWIDFDKYASTTGSLNYQVKIYETTGVIEFVYGNMLAGSAAYVYALGLNGSWATGGATAALLLTQQTANTTTFSSTASNSLATLPASNSQLTFTPPTPTAAPTSLSFTAVTKTGMTLNWTDNASNEVGYAIFNSTDNINFNFVAQTAANIGTSVVSGLLTNTTYYWQVRAVTEGKLSAALTGSQATLPPGTITAIASTAWNVATTWNCTCLPASGDDVIIPNGFNVSLSSDQACNSLTIGSGASGSLTVGNNGTARTLTVTTNITVNAGGTLTTGATAATHVLNVGGNIVNNGTLNLSPTTTRIMNVTFNKNGNQTISGTGGTTRFNRMTLNMGASETNVLNITASNFAIGNTNFLTLTNGTFKLSTPTATITPFTTATAIPATSGIWLNNAGATMSSTAGSISLYGYVRATAGIFNIGSAVNNNLVSYGGTIIVDGGTMNVRGCLTNGGTNILTDFTISSGTFKVAVTAPTTAGEAPFKMDQAGSTFNMSGGTIIIGNPGAGNLGYLNTGGTLGTVSGGTLQMGDAATGAGTTMQINTSVPIWDLVNSSSVAVTSRLVTNDLTVLNSVIINSGTLNSNGLDITFGGNWANSGTFTSSTGTVTLNGAAGQTITRTGGETFNKLIVSGSGTKVLGSAITVNSDLTINSTLDVSAPNFAITAKGDWTNTGTFVPRSGTVTLSGATTQTLTKLSAMETFYNLTTNNPGIIEFAFTTNVTVTNTLNLTSGIIDINGNTFTLGVNGIASSLLRTSSTTTNWLYGGTFKRYWLASLAVSSTAGNFYGLFPMGTSGASTYRPVEINTTVNPSTGGYFTVNHTDAGGATDLSPVYNDAGTNILRIANAKFETSISGVTGGTYNINVTMNGLAAGTATDLRLAVYTGGTTAGAVGTHLLAVGTTNPTVKRTGITNPADFNNDFRVATTNTTNTPMIRYIYTRKATGNWNDNNAVTGTWSRTSGGAGAPCNCVPTASDYVVVSPSQTVTVNAAGMLAGFLEISNGAIVIGTQTLSINKDINTIGSGKFLPTAGVWTVGRDINLTGTTSSAFAVTPVISGDLNIGAGTTLTMSGGTLNLAKELVVNGTLALGAQTLNLTGANGRTISNSGTGSITGNGTININTGDKIILAGTVLTINPVVAIAAGISVSNNGSITLTNNLTGASAASTWANETNATLNCAAAVLATGSLTASAIPNTVNYNGAGAQNVKAAIYHDLTITSGNTATFAGTTTVNNNLTVALGTASIGAFTTTVSGTTSITGTLNITSATGEKTFNDIIVNAGGTWNATTAVPFTITGNIQNNNTFTANTGFYDLAGTGKTISGTSTLTIPNVSVSGSYTNNGTLTISTALAGVGSLIQGANHTLTISGSSGITTLDASINPNTVNYNGAGAQNVNPATYHDLTITSGNTAYFAGSTTVNNNLTVTLGTASIGAFATTVSGTTSITGTLNITSATGTKTFNNILVNAGGTWNATTAVPFVINGNIQNDNAFTANTGLYTLTGTSKTLSGTSILAIPSVSISGSYTNNDNTLTISTSLSGAGSLTQGASKTLNIGGNSTITTLDASATGNIVNYNAAGAQSVSGATPSYYHLNLSGSGLKTLSGNLNVLGNLTLSGTAQLDVSATAYSIDLKNNWNITSTNADPFVERTGTVMLSGTTQSITTVLAGGETFNNLTLSNAGTKTLGSAIGIVSNLTLSGTAQLDVSPTAYSIDLKGNWNITSTNADPFMERTGTVTLSGTTQSIATVLAAGETFNNLTLSNTGIKTLGSAIGVVGNLTLSGTAQLDVSASAYAIDLKKDWNITSTNTNPFVERTGTVTLSGTTQSITTVLAGGETFNNLTLSNTGIKTLGSAIGVVGNLTLSGTAQLDVSATVYPIDLKGNWNITSTNANPFVERTGTVTLSGTTQSIATVLAGGETFNNLTLSNTGIKTLGSAIGVVGNLTLSGTAQLDVSASNYSVDLKNNWSITSTNADPFVERTGTVTLSGTTQSIATVLAGGETFNNLTLSNTGIKTLGSAIGVVGNLTLSGTAQLDVSATVYPIDLKGNWNITSTNADPFVERTGTVTLSGTAQSIATVLAGGETFNNLTLSNTGIKTLGSAIGVVGNLTLSGTAQLDVSASNYSVDLKNNWNITSTNANPFVERTGTVTLSGTTQSITTVLAGGETFNNLTLSNTGTKTLGSAIGVAGNLSVSGTAQLDISSLLYPIDLKGNWNITSTNANPFVERTGSVTLSGVGAQSITTVLAGGETFNNLALTVSGTKTLGSAISVVGNLSVSGTTQLDVSASAYSIDLKNNWSITSTNANPFVERTGTVTLSGTTQSITTVLAGGETFNNLTLSNTGTKTLGSAIGVAGNLSLSGTAQLDISSSLYAIDLKGNWNITSTNADPFVERTGTVTLSGTTQSIATVLASGETFNNLILSNTGAKTLGSAIGVVGNLTLSGTAQLDVSASAYPINLKGNWNVTSANANPFVERTGIVTLSGATQSITTVLAGGETFNTLVLSGAGIKTLGSAITCLANFTNSSGSTFDVSVSNFPVTVKGNWTNDGLFVAQTGTVTLNGGTAQTMSSTGLTRFNNLTINNTNGVSLIAGSYYLKEAFTLNNGTFTTNGNLFKLESNAIQTARMAPVTGTGAVNGNFTVEKYIPTRNPYWSDLSSPVVSTLQDWGNELYLVYGAMPSSNVFIYSETLGDYDAVGSSTTLSPGKGFEVYLSDDASLSNFSTKTLTSVGFPNVGTIVIPIEYNAANGVPYTVDPVNGYGGENLVGNPFASTIDVGLLNFSPQVLPAVDVFDNVSQSFVTLNSGDLIGPHQGFWAYTSGAASGTISVPEIAKTNDLATGVRFTQQSDPLYFQLAIGVSDNSNTYKQILKLACAQDASDGWDKKDFPFRKSRNSKTPVITAIAGSIPLSVSTFSSNHTYYEMPLKTSVAVAGSYQITSKGISFVDDVYPCVRLEDKLLHTFIDLHEQSNYVFYANPADDASRFVLHFSASKEGCGQIITEITKNNFDAHVNVLQNQFGNTIKFDLLESTVTNIALMNIMGQDLTKEITITALDQSVNINLPDDFNGIYFVRISSSKGNIIRKFYR